MVFFIVHIIISSANLWDEAFRSLPQNYIQLCKTWKWKQLCDHEWKAGSVTACHTYVSFQKLALYSRNRYIWSETHEKQFSYMRIAFHVFRSRYICSLSTRPVSETRHMYDKLLQSQPFIRGHRAAFIFTSCKAECSFAEGFGRLHLINLHYWWWCVQ